MTEVPHAFGREGAKEARSIEALANACIRTLVDRGVLPQEPIDWAFFRDVMDRCAEGVEVDQSAITTRMARLLFGIACVVRPTNALVVGSYQGASLLWLAAGAGPSCRTIGVDLDENANATARSNVGFLRLDAEILRLDGHDAGALFDRNLDLVLLDAETKVEGTSSKAIYSTLLEALLPHLSDDAIVLGHDACWPKFASNFIDFKLFASRTGVFGPSLSLAIDRYGLLVLKKARRP